MPTSNPLRARLMSGKTATGTVCVLGSVEAIELACHAGYDFVLVDWQHGSFSRDLMRESVRAIDATACSAVARPPSDDPYLIQWLLDMGYLSLLIPMVNRADQAQAIVQASYYPPQGQRSQSTTRASMRFGADYRQRFNDELLLMVMIETVEAADNINAIAATPGIGCCFVGGTDLASSMGLEPGQPRPASFEHAIEMIRSATVQAGKIPAIATGSPDEAKRRIEQGFRLVTVRTDLRILGDGFRAVRESMEG